jgi:hypothetical protein
MELRREKVPACWPAAQHSRCHRSRRPSRSRTRAGAVQRKCLRSAATAWKSRATARPNSASTLSAANSASDNSATRGSRSTGRLRTSTARSIRHSSCSVSTVSRANVSVATSRRHSILAQRSLDGGNHPGDRVRLDIGMTDEEVEVDRAPVDRATQDERRAASQRESIRLGQSTDDVEQPLLGQHGSSIPRRSASQPARTRRTCSGR